MDTIGLRLMSDKSEALELASIECQMCVWLERGYMASLVELPVEEDCAEEELVGVQGYATEILLHRRMLHISSADSPN